MTRHERKIMGTPTIRRLPEAAANRIAAGEVVERPASAVKELVENAIDAGAARIVVTVQDAGKTLIRVEDDGHGIPPDQLALALERHATSKIDGSDLVNITTFGFRGEALPSLASVARLTLTSRTPEGDAWSLTAVAGRLENPRPAARGPGTTVEVRDLFAATPARLKFLRSDRSELAAITAALRPIALAHPEIAFALKDLSGERTLIDLPRQSLDARLAKLLGRAFAENAVAIDAEREGLRLAGHAALPTYSRGAAVEQVFLVNTRPVRDRQLTGALRAAYQDLMAKDRHPAAVLALTVPPERVDVNVHPAKAEVRFREPGVVRGLVISAIRHAMAGAGHRVSSTVAAGALGAFREPAAPWRGPDRPSRTAIANAFAFDRPAAPPAPEPPADAAPDAEPPPAAGPLGTAQAQLHGTYIVSETPDGIVLTDQHAAHERLVYERLKAQAAASGIARQALLVPEIVALPDDDAARLLAEADALARLGLVVEPFGPGAVAVRETPAILGPVDCAGLLRDIADELADTGASSALETRINAILSRMSCHGSIRAGRAMRRDEMDALLRQIETTPGAAQCNHGRPTHIALTLADIERLFGRRT